MGEARVLGKQGMSGQTYGAPLSSPILQRIRRDAYVCVNNVKGFK